MSDTHAPKAELQASQFDESFEKVLRATAENSTIGSIKIAAAIVSVIALLSTVSASLTGWAKGWMFIVVPVGVLSVLACSWVLARRGRFSGPAVFVIFSIAGTLPGLRTVAHLLYAPSVPLEVVSGPDLWFWAVVIIGTGPRYNPTLSRWVGIWCASLYLLIELAVTNGPLLERLAVPGIKAMLMTLLGFTVAYQGKVIRYLVRRLFTRLREEESRLQTTEHARARAEQHSQAKSAFLMSMNHEFRTPLNSILGYAKLLQDENDPDRQRQDKLRTIERSGQHLLRLINDVLDVGRIEAGKMEPEIAPLRVGELTQEIVKVCRPSADDKNIVLSLDLSDSVPDWVEGDARRMRQILLNLVGNAIKFTDAGEVRLEAAWTWEDGLTIAVIDSGCGIDADQLETIFEPFEQTGDAAHRALGTGLGLSISRKMARLMGGDLTVSSQLGRGSTFVLCLPAPACEAGRHAPSAGERTVEPQPSLPRDELERLLQLVWDGRPDEVARQAKSLADANATSRPFIDELLGLARAPDDDALEALLVRALDSNREL